MQSLGGACLKFESKLNLTTNSVSYVEWRDVSGACLMSSSDTVCSNLKATLGNYYFSWVLFKKKFIRNLKPNLNLTFVLAYMLQKLTSPIPLKSTLNAPSDWSLNEAPLLKRITRAVSLTKWFRLKRLVCFDGKFQMRARRPE